MASRSRGTDGERARPLAMLSEVRLNSGERAELPDPYPVAEPGPAPKAVRRKGDCEVRPKVDEVPESGRACTAY